MALRPCRECGREVSTEAVSCPQCGVPEPTRHAPPESEPEPEPEPTPAPVPEATAASQKKANRALFLLIAALLGGLVVAELIVQRSSNGTPTPSPAPQATPAPPPPPAPPESLLAAAKERLAQEDYSRAIYYAKRVRRFYPDSPQVEEAGEIIPKAAKMREQAAAEAARRRAEREREAQQRQLARKWTYQVTTDDMTGGTTRTARIRSDNTVNFDFPYQGPQRGTLMLRTHPTYGRDVIFRIREGQILCNTYSRCRVRVRFDDGSPRTWPASPPSDQSTEVIFLRNYPGFVQRLRRAELVRIQPEVFQEGNPTFEFRVGGYDHSRYTGG